MKERVLSGMRPTGALHLGHYHGALKNWVRLQATHDCYFFVADWHALTTHYEHREVIEKNVFEMVIDWLAARLDPVKAGRRLSNYLKVMTLEAQTVARACGKSHLHNLEPEDLCALTVEAAAMAQVPLAGTSWIPGRGGY